eukprot:SAG11_NODE_13832_length_637_cov_1.241636_1_plen_79_part_00
MQRLAPPVRMTLWAPLSRRHCKTNGHGLTFAEFSTAIAGAKERRGLGTEALRQVFQVVDSDGDGFISLREFSAFVGGV